MRAGDFDQQIYAGPAPMDKSIRLMYGIGHTPFLRLLFCLQDRRLPPLSITSIL